MKCPNCGTECFAHAKQCKCGYSFEIFGRPRTSAQAFGAGGEFGPPPGGASGNSSGGASRKMILGLVLLIGGIAVTALTYQSAASSGGGRYVIAHGPIIFGGIMFLRGVGEFLGR